MAVQIFFSRYSTCGEQDTQGQEEARVVLTPSTHFADPKVTSLSSLEMQDPDPRGITLCDG